jgi:PmbA protein
MSNEMMGISEFILKTAKDAGASDCRVAFRKRRFFEVQYRARKPEVVKEASTKEISIEVFASGCYSAQSLSDVRKEVLKSFVVNTIESARSLEPDPYRSLPDPKYYEGRKDADLQLMDIELKKITSEKRHAMAKEIEEACLDAGGSKAISAGAMVHDETYEELVVSSNGFFGEMQSSNCFVFAEMTAQDDGGRRPTAYYDTAGRSYAKLPSCRDMGKMAALRAINLIGSKKLKTETLPIIIENRVVDGVLCGFISAMSGKTLQQMQSFLLDKKGKKVGSDIFTLIDDPHVTGGLGSRPYDGDGLATKKREMVQKGILNEYFIDWYYSRKLGIEPTTGGPSNLILPPGKRSVSEIMKDLGRGILINGFIGGNSNSNTGDFSIGITGRLFDKGEFIQAVAEMNIAGNHLEFWNKLAEAANDPWVYSSLQMPSLVFTDVVVSGV